MIPTHHTPIPNKNKIADTNEEVKTDGGFPINKIFKLTEATRVSDLDWAQDSQNRLYAINQKDTFASANVVRVDAQQATVEKIDNPEYDDLDLEEIPDLLSTTKGD